MCDIIRGDKNNVNYSVVINPTLVSIKMKPMIACTCVPRPSQSPRPTPSPRPRPCDRYAAKKKRGKAICTEYEVDEMDTVITLCRDL